MAWFENLAEMKSEKTKSWGKWVFNPGNLTLNHGSDIEVDLERIISCGSLLDWLTHVSQKSWCEPRTVGDLLAALDAILNIRANLHVRGEDRVIDGAALAREYAEKLARKKI